MYPPKRSKYRKAQKGSLSFSQDNQIKLHSGRYAIISLESYRLPAKTIEAVRRVITRKSKRVGKLWVRLHPSIPVTGKPNGLRMGKGKGSLAFWACRVKTGQVMYEIDGIPKVLALEIFKAIRTKLPMKSALIVQ